ncbi:MAG TPA: hypothetical protein VGO60_12135 [Iamia sp.]|nr:hypothetical protein [Iamia sp.]
MAEGPNGETAPSTAPHDEPGPMIPVGITPPPALAIDEAMAFVEDAAVRMAATGLPTEDHDLTRCFPVEDVVKARVGTVQSDIVTWGRMLPGETLGLIDTDERTVQEIDPLIERADARGMGLANDHEELEREAAVGDTDAFAGGTGDIMLGIGGLLALVEMPLISPVVGRYFDLPDAGVEKYLAAFVVIAIQSLAAGGAGAAIKEWQSSSDERTRRRFMGGLALALLGFSVTLATTIIGLRVAHFYESAAGRNGGVAIAFFAALQLLIVTVALAAGWYGHSPLRRRLANLQTRVEEGLGDVGALQRQKSACLAHAVKVADYRASIDRHVRGAQERARTDGVLVVEHFRMCLDMALDGTPDADMRRWVVANAAKPLFSIPPDDDDLDDDLFDDVPPSLF